ncbi:MAG: hypothetical protein ACOX7R_05465 [Acetivibrionales bacterium]|jgi:hypothetical protein
MTPSVRNSVLEFCRRYLRRGKSLMDLRINIQRRYKISDRELASLLEMEPFRAVLLRKGINKNSLNKFVERLKSDTALSRVTYKKLIMKPLEEFTRDELFSLLAKNFEDNFENTCWQISEKLGYDYVDVKKRASKFS